MKQYELNIIPSKLKYKSAPAVDQKIPVSFQQNSELNLEFDRISTVSLPQVYDDERQLVLFSDPLFK